MRVRRVWWWVKFRNPSPEAPVGWTMGQGLPCYQAEVWTLFLMAISGGNALIIISSSSAQYFSDVLVSPRFNMLWWIKPVTYHQCCYFLQVLIFDCRNDDLAFIQRLIRKSTIATYPLFITRQRPFNAGPISLFFHRRNDKFLFSFNSSDIHFFIFFTFQISFKWRTIVDLCSCVVLSPRFSAIFYRVWNG